MLVKTKTYVYIDCKCGKALEHSVADSFSEDYTVIVEPCSCGVEKHLMNKYGLKTAEEVYKLGFGDGHMTAKMQERKEKEESDESKLE